MTFLIQAKRFKLDFDVFNIFLLSANEFFLRLNTGC